MPRHEDSQVLGWPGLAVSSLHAAAYASARILLGDKKDVGRTERCANQVTFVVEALSLV